MKKKTKIISIASALVILAVGGTVFLRKAPQKDLVLETVKVERGEISDMITATGTVEPILQVEVGTQVSGVINRIYVDYNSSVTKGQLIAELDKTVLESEQKSSAANLAACKTEYEYQLKNYTRSKQLFEKKIISDTEFETATYQYEKAKSSYDKSRADMVKAQTNMGYAMIYSPIDGVVLSRAVDEGQTVAASFNTPTLFTIANDLKKMQVVADVDEADIGQVVVGQQVTFTVDAFPDDVFKGEVTQVRLEATTTSNVVTYEVIINAPNLLLKLKPGLTANVTIYTLKKSDILTLPAKAFRFEPAVVTTATPSKKSQSADATRKTVWIKGPKGLTEKSVVIGLTNEVDVEIVSGLKEGEEVVVGQTVQIPENDLAEESQQETSPFMPKRPGKK